MRTGRLAIVAICAAAACHAAGEAKVDDAETARRYAERLLSDPSRPRYHFTIDGNGMPGDSNGAFWHKGRYHLMYLYKRPQGFCWGHSSSVDLIHWRRHPDAIGVGPSFLPLPLADGRPSGKHLLLFISHNRGCQYYIGTYDTAVDKFLPERHGRMTWADKSYFAPEALIDGKGRQIAWVWLLDNLKNDYAQHGWSGVYGLPRSLWLAADGTLGQAPVEELKGLRVNGRAWDGVRLAAGEVKSLGGFPGDCCEMELEMDAESAANFALAVQSTDGASGTVITCDTAAGNLVFDASKGGRRAMEAVERAPFRLAKGEALRLRVFVDRPVVEVYANDRQAICRRVYSTSRGMMLVARGGSVSCRVLRAWEMAAANPF